MTTVIDSHLHVWDRGRSGYPWLRPDLGELYADFSLDQVAPELKASGVTGVILVQADDDDRDTEQLLEVAAHHASVLGVVGFAPLHRPDELHGRLEQLMTDPRVVGIRNLTHDRADDAWLLRPEVERGLDIVEDASLPVDIVTARAAQLTNVAAVCGRHPGLTLVLDHLGKPPIGGDLTAWRRDLKAAAEHPLLNAKVSGLYASGGPVTDAQLAPVFDWALECFGPRRLMLGSDWPIAVAAGGYRRTWAALTRLVDQLSAAERDELRSGTAVRCYGLQLVGEARER